MAKCWRCTQVYCLNKTTTGTGFRGGNGSGLDPDLTVFFPDPSPVSLKYVDPDLIVLITFKLINC